MLPQAGSAECTEGGDQEGVFKFRNLSLNRGHELQYLEMIRQLNTDTADIYDGTKNTWHANQMCFKIESTFSLAHRELVTSCLWLSFAKAFRAPLEKLSSLKAFQFHGSLLFDPKTGEGGRVQEMQTNIFARLEYITSTSKVRQFGLPAP